MEGSFVRRTTREKWGEGRRGREKGDNEENVGSKLEKKKKEEEEGEGGEEEARNRRRECEKMDAGIKLEKVETVGRSF